MLRWAVMLCLLLLAQSRVALALPPGFVQEDVGSGWTEVAGVTFDANGRAYVWERAGLVWIVENGVKRPTPLIDIRDEVGGWRDFGLLGFALHPNFAQNGYIYLYYVVDRHHLQNAGTASYNPNANDYFSATTGRITRYTALAAASFNSVNPASRLVLAGATASDGCPILYESHGTGSLVFGTDGTLLAACGDGASYTGQDNGSRPETYYAQALADGVIAPKENVGAFRSQLVDSLSGKLWRIDPTTGAGVSGNPFYEPGNPFSKSSRVWTLGVRNPYRMTLRPGSGSHEVADVNPGTIYLGDVGWDTREDLHVVKSGGRNLGWPIFEGMDPHPGYSTANVVNEDAPNPLFNGSSCNRPFFYFRELIVQESLTPPDPTFANPCGGTITTEPTFMHLAPEVDWGHWFNGPARAKVFTGNVLTPATIGDAGSPVAGDGFGGNASTGGVWYTGTTFPAEYQNSYFHADYGAGWIRNFGFDASDRPTRVALFHDGADGVVHVAAHPTDGSLYYVSWGSAVRRVRWLGLGNEPPLAVASASRRYGSTPLAVQFTGSDSSDPEGSALAYAWSFGDGATSPLANPLHVFTAPAGVPTRFDVTLTVTDATALGAVASIAIWVNNSPPQVSVTSPVDGALFPLSAPSNTPLQATFVDAEHGSGQLACGWQTTLHHNNHIHTEPTDTSCTSSALISPVGCDGNSYFYTVTLTVTDPLGLAASDSVSLVPDCQNPLDTDGDGYPDASDNCVLRANSQEDSGGVGSAGPDGIGDACQCGDLDADGDADASDRLRLRLALADPIAQPLLTSEAKRCSVSGDAACDVLDVVREARALAGLAPALTQSCIAAQP